VDPLEIELVAVGVEKGLGLAVLDPVPDPVAKGLVVPDRDPDGEGVCNGVVPGVAGAVGDRVAVPDLVIDLVRVPEGVTRGEGVPV
jgi:hypothetical protein